jgi:hypothetical protein
VCVVTGSALKQPAAISLVVGEPALRIRADAAEMRHLLVRWRRARA